MASAGTTTPAASTVWRPAFAVDVHRTLRLLRRGPHDPAYQVSTDGSLWRTTQMSRGPAAYVLRQRGPHEVRCQAWGTGADEVVEQLPELLGARDDPAGFEPLLPVLERAHRRHRGLRIMRTTRVLEALVPAVLEQRVIGAEAFSSWRRLLHRYGEVAPGPAPPGMRVPPTAEVWRAIPSWEWHRAGVDPGRAATAVRCATSARQLQEAVDMEPVAAERRLRAVPGVGAWTAAEVAQRALGDADAISVGDYHLAKDVGWVFTGRPVDDAAMLDLLEPWRGHRGRVIRLLEADHTLHRPRHGARLAYQDHRAH